MARHKMAKKGLAGDKGNVPGKLRAAAKKGGKLGRKAAQTLKKFEEKKKG